MADIDYEAEYNNRARVPEHEQIFLRWAQDAEKLSRRYAQRGPRRTWARLRRYAPADNRFISPARGRQRAARHVRAWRLLALCSIRPVQSSGARVEHARCRGRGGWL